MKWRRFNVGANSPSEAGLYFSWGNIEGHAANSGYDFSLDVYESTPGASIMTDLSSEEDMARVNLGAPWRTPTVADFEELVANSTSIWTTLNGIYGRLFTSNINSNILFLPAAGLYNGTSLNSRDVAGWYWTKNYNAPTTSSSMMLNNEVVDVNRHDARRLGIVVRAVMDSNPNLSVVHPTPEE